jgi:hypothetical protein
MCVLCSSAGHLAARRGRGGDGGHEHGLCAELAMRGVGGPEHLLCGGPSTRGNGEHED